MAYITYDPIRSTAVYEKKYFVQIPQPDDGFVILLTAANAETLEIMRGSKITPSKIRRGKYTDKYEIDVSKRDILFIIEAFCCDDTHKFSIEIQMEAQVLKPVLIYKNNLRDIAELAKNSLHQKIIKCAKTFTKDEKVDLEVKLEEILCRAEKISDGAIGLKLQSVNVNSDDLFKVQQAKKRTIIDQGEIKSTELKIAGDLKDTFSDYPTAILSEYVTGEITVGDVYQRITAHEKYRFDEMMRRHKASVGEIERMRDVEDISEEEARHQIKELTQSNFKSFITEGAKETASENDEAKVYDEVD